MTDSSHPQSPQVSAHQSRRYRFLSLLGSGGFGEVYLADAISSTGFRKQVAIKILKAEWADHEEVRGRLRDEASVLGLLRHPNIVSAENFSMLDGHPALVMEYVPGISLLDAIRLSAENRAPGVRAVAAIGAAIASALDAAYWRPVSGTNEPIAVLHRDVKPGNVRLTPHGEVKLLDFGIARSEVLDRSVQTTQNQPGSLSYMAPELLQGERASPASDIYSLGVVLMECFTQRRFGWAGATEEEHTAKVTGALKRLTDVPSPFLALLEEVLAYDASRRPLAADLVRACRGMERSVRGVALREWCETQITGELLTPGTNTEGPLVGRTFLEDTATSGLLVETSLDSGSPHAPRPTGAEADPSVPTVEPTPPTRRPTALYLAGGVGIIGILGAVALLSFALSRPDGGPDIVLSGSIEPAASTKSADAEAIRPAIQPNDPPEPVNPPEPPPDSTGSQTASATQKTSPKEATPKPEDAPKAEAPPKARPTPKPEAAPKPEATPKAEPPPETTPEPAALRRIKLSSVPLGLPITVDGHATGKKTPAKLELTVGPHKVRFDNGRTISLVVPASGHDLFTYDQVADDWRK